MPESRLGERSKDYVTGVEVFLFDAALAWRRESAALMLRETGDNLEGPGQLLPPFFTLSCTRRL